MKDEIKEILECLSLIARNEYVPDELLNDEMCQQLLDYITNLQEENEKLKEQIKKDNHILGCNFASKDKYKQELEDYKSRNEKAIEKLKTLIPICIMPNNTLIHGTEKAKTIEETLNILNGDDE